MKNKQNCLTTVFATLALFLLVGCVVPYEKINACIKPGSTTDLQNNIPKWNSETLSAALDRSIDVQNMEAFSLLIASNAPVAGSHLLAACKKNNEKMVEVLLSRKGDWNSETLSDALDCSIEVQNMEVFSLLLASNAPVAGEHLLTACKINNEKIIEVLLSRKADPNFQLDIYVYVLSINPNSQSGIPVQMQTEYGSLMTESIPVLVSRRPYVMKYICREIVRGPTPLYYAILNTNVVVAEMLIKAGADVTKPFNAITRPADPKTFVMERGEGMLIVGYNPRMVDSVIKATPVTYAAFQAPHSEMRKLFYGDKKIIGDP